MIRYTIFIIAIVGSAATAIASLPSHTSGFDAANQTVLFKNVEWTATPILTEECAKADCSDTPQS